MLILTVFLGVLAALVLVLLGNTAVKTLKARKLTGEHPAFTKEELEAYGLGLQEMIRCKTVSVRDSYDDTEFAKLRAVAEKRFPLLHEKAERMTLAKDFWLYKIPGKDTGRNILLMSHHDVVPADEEWLYDPFEGKIVDGVIYGRGTADTKGSLYGILAGMEEMLAEGFEPAVNVYIGSSYNEELGGDGATSARAYFKEHNIQLEVVLDEGGAIVDPPLGNMKCEKCAMVAVHEKGR
ncbi:MAG: M20/M25/M40 family metallo-hydrolase, partial [Clostridia bacterium]|nr:M20/M25/M40 family metallo-hydrolase [Clostridia bacterium]